MHVAFLAARAVPNDCGTWVAVRSMMEALARYGSFEYTFEINDSQTDLMAKHGLNRRLRSVCDLRKGIPWSIWADGIHPQFSWLDTARDGVYRNLLRGWSISKFSYGRAAAGLGADVCHYPFQDLAFLPDRIGMIYTQVAHDFRQEHLPELESKKTMNRLRGDYEGYRRASALCVLGETCKEDAVRFAGVNPERVFVTPYGPWEVLPPASTQFQQSLRERFQLPDAFIFYPAPTRVHKNHARLVRALSGLKRNNCRVPLVTTGKQQPYYNELRALIRGLNMEQEVIFTDYVDLTTLYALYDMATAVVLPTLFEGATGIPLLEALSKGKPIAAARVCEIPAALGESGLLFDPHSEKEIANAVLRLWESPKLREDLANRALKSNLERSWGRFTKATEAALRWAYHHPNR